MVDPLEPHVVPTEGLMSVHVHGDDAGPVVRVTGEVVSATVLALRARLEPLLRTDPVPRVVLDLSAVEFVDSSGLSLLVRVHKQLRVGGGALAVVVTGTPVRRLLEISGLVEVPEVHPSLEQALTAPSAR